MSDRKLTADPIVVEIVRNGVLAVTEEMKTNLMRTAYNIIIYEALDFTTGLFTPEGETVSIGIGLPMFTCCMAHWLDIGGTLGGMTTDIFSEGIQIPILKLHKGGVVNEDVVDIIRQNVRLPSRAMGDLRAQVTAVKTGERRFLQLIERYGREPVLGAIAAIMDQAEALARARTRSIPDGVYEAESYMDDDGIEVGKPVPIRVRVTVAGEEMTIDLTDVSRQVRGF